MLPGRLLRVLGLCAAGVALAVSPAVALDNGLALTPQMGWNSWNRFACDVSADLIERTADALVSTGLASLGYTYVNIDDCWQVSRDAHGRIQSDPVRFPDMHQLAQSIHKRGLKLGVYSDAGNATCQGRPGSLGYEKIDAETYAEWEVDYLKYDNCNNEGIKPETRYPPMRDALNATGRPILFSMCEWGQDSPYEWAPSVGNSWRTTSDIHDEWSSMLANLDQNNDGASAAGPGHWNDPDMLEVGNDGMTDAEYRAHFSLWAVVKAPLLIGCDVTNMSLATLDTLSNAEVIAVNQDPLGVQGTPRDKPHQVWAGPLADSAWAVVLLNRGDSPLEIGFTWAQIGAPDAATLHVRDLWLRKDLGAFLSQFPPVTLQPHESRMFRVAQTSEAVVLPLVASVVEAHAASRSNRKIILTEQ